MWQPTCKKDIERNLIQSLDADRADSLLKLWLEFDPQEIVYSFPEFSKKFMPVEEYKKCEKWIRLIKIEMENQQQVIDLLTDIKQGQEDIKQGLRQLIRGQNYVSDDCCRLL
jgi:hypothetical protein